MEEEEEKNRDRETEIDGERHIWLGDRQTDRQISNQRKHTNLNDTTASISVRVTLIHNTRHLMVFCVHCLMELTCFHWSAN